MTMTETQRVAWWLDLVRRNLWIQQFGQPAGTTSTAGGKLGCTQTMLQLLELGWHGRRLTHDDVSRMSGYTAAQTAAGTGMTRRNVAAFLVAAKLPYRIIDVDDPATAGGLMRRANLHGPVLFGAAYSSQPEWFGFTYKGVTADGKPNGYAFPKGHAGKTQLTGFTGAHMEALLGYHATKAADGTVIKRTCHIKDPNHASGLRPERPPYDDVLAAQFAELYASFRDALNRPLYAVVPTTIFNR